MYKHVNKLVLDKSETAEQQVERFEAMLKHVNENEFNGENFIKKYTLSDNDFSIINGLLGLGGHTIEAITTIIDPTDIPKTNKAIQATVEWTMYIFKDNDDKRIWTQIIHEEFRDEDAVTAYYLLRQLSATVYKVKEEDALHDDTNL